MKERMRSVLRTFAHEQHEVLILGAWGCGCNGLPPEHVASLWHHFLTEDQEFVHCFRKVIFAVPDRTPLEAFRKVFDKECWADII